MLPTAIYHELSEQAKQAVKKGLSLREAWYEYLAQKEEYLEKAIGKDNKPEAWFFFEKAYLIAKRGAK